ncbi:hypothetical protein GCM10023189_31760 [Nibrella saemangeumensis]|uniref:Methyltransferase FkbM domain-containing protein n=1 Tax=Nibrella saemangeumensis TaxID=1084526 RepID=A0ABP8N2N5_9BACT
MQFLMRLVYPLLLRDKLTWRLKRFFPIRQEKNISLHFNPNIKLDLTKNDIGHQSIIYNGFYELPLTKAILKLSQKGGTLIDVGANYGYFSVLWVGSNPSNTAIAFEASPLNIKPLINNIEKNGFANRVTIEPFALGEKIGNLSFSLGNKYGQTGWGGFAFGQSEDSIQVEVTTIDKYVDEKGLSEISVLKIDVEGADTWVIKGASKLIQERRVKHIFYEENIVRMIALGIKPNEAKDLLIDSGYVVDKISEGEYHAYLRG